MLRCDIHNSLIVTPPHIQSVGREGDCFPYIISTPGRAKEGFSWDRPREAGAFF